MTNNSVFLRYVNNGYTNFLNAELETAKISRTGIFICLNGEVDCTLDGVAYHIVPHTMVTYFAFTELRITNRSSDLQGILVGGNLEAIQPLLYKISNFNSLFLIRNNPFVELTEQQEKNMIRYAELIDDLLNNMQGNITIDNEKDKQMLQVHLIQLEMLSNCFMLNIVSCYNQYNINGNGSSRKEDVLMKFVASLYKNYREEHEVSFYSEQQFLTSRYFSAIIKEKSGKTPSQWIATALLVEAKKKLRQSSLSVKEISEDLHFPNQSYFGKWFKNLTGVSPLEFKSGKAEAKDVEDEFTEMIRKGTAYVNKKA